MKELFRKKITGILLVIIVFSFLFWQEKNEKSEIEKNKGTSIAKITSKGRKNTVNYIFKYNGKWVSGRDSGRGKAEIGEYYKVNFDMMDPENSNIITKRSIHPMTLVNQGVEINGIVERIGYISDTYLDLYISYVYNKETFEFRTRKHIDSLPCERLSDCNNSLVKLKISDDFPDLNNLYFESYDRSKLRQKLKVQSE